MYDNRSGLLDCWAALPAGPDQLNGDPTEVLGPLEVRRTLGRPGVHGGGLTLPKDKAQIRQPDVPADAGDEGFRHRRMVSPESAEATASLMMRAHSSRPLR